MIKSLPINHISLQLNAEFTLICVSCPLVCDIFGEVSRNPIGGSLEVRLIDTEKFNLEFSREYL